MHKQTWMLVAGLALAAGQVRAVDRNFSGDLTGLGSGTAGSQLDAAQAAPAPVVGAPASPLAPPHDYHLGAGDKVRLTVFGEADLSGEFDVDGTGVLALPLVGDIHAGGLTPHDLENAIAGKLAHGYLKNPRVNVAVLNFRPFFIVGEVNHPGSYAYVDGLTVINAVALAGGYTPRAKTSVATLERATDAKHKEKSVDEHAAVGPGDVIKIQERFF